MRISDWSSDVCSSDLLTVLALAQADSQPGVGARRLVDRHLDRAVFDAVDADALLEIAELRLVQRPEHPHPVAPDPGGRRQLEVASELAVVGQQIGRASCRARGCEYV